MTEYRPEPGDRVRITTRTLEGEVVRATFNANEGYLQEICLKGDDGFYGWVRCLSSITTIEKLQDPEPVWVNGDVIEVDQLAYTNGVRQAVRINGIWVFTDTGQTAGKHFMTNHWPESVRILYKADTERPNSFGSGDAPKAA